ncbi:MAG: tetraacyldisaccharide 4'-kinase [Deltaproteobacteria bacterium]|nr:tetraacyldisaccharide 4'-kinase [Deltaproteobacteria bacterium]
MEKKISKLAFRMIDQVPYRWSRFRRIQGTVWPLLIPLSSLYAEGMKLRGRLYRSGCLRIHRLPCPVISVGNLTVGGTGKTPTVILLARILKEAGRHPAVISRGYRGRARGRSNVVSDGHNLLMGFREAGDEPVLIGESLPDTPVLIGRRRINPGLEAVERFGADLIVLDDGFQHLSLDRQIDLTLIDSRYGLGNGRVLPAGPLRESPEALARASAILLTKWDGRLEPGRGELAARRWNPTAPVFHARYRAVALVDAKGTRSAVQELRGAKVCAVAGVADAEHFLSTLSSLGAQVINSCLFTDHYRYPDRILPWIEGRARKADCVITTEKDMVKLGGRVSDILALAVEQEIIEHEPFLSFLLERIEMHER